MNYTVAQLQLYLADAENPNGINVTNNGPMNGGTPVGVEVGETVTLTAKINGNPVGVGGPRRTPATRSGATTPTEAPASLSRLPLRGAPVEHYV